jgi:predicted metal-binding membrane protein
LGDGADGHLGEAWQDRREIVANRNFQPTTGFDNREDSGDAWSGFLLVLWTTFTLAATLWLRGLALISPMMVGTSPLLGGLVLATAGVYQWTPFKHACLRHCRAPLGFVLNYWRDGGIGAFLMGLRYGSYCLGCCRFLMTILFEVGVMNLVWIAALSLFVLAEKIIPGGFWVAKVAGGVLVAWAGWLVLSNGA